MTELASIATLRSESDVIPTTEVSVDRATNSKRKNNHSRKPIEIKKAKKDDDKETSSSDEESDQDESDDLAGVKHILGLSPTTPAAEALLLDGYLPTICDDWKIVANHINAKLMANHRRFMFLQTVGFRAFNDFGLFLLFITLVYSVVLTLILNFSFWRSLLRICIDVLLRC